VHARSFRQPFLFLEQAIGNPASSRDDSDQPLQDTVHTAQTLIHAFLSLSCQNKMEDKLHIPLLMDGCISLGSQLPSNWHAGSRKMEDAQFGYLEAKETGPYRTGLLMLPQSVTFARVMSARAMQAGKFNTDRLSFEFDQDAWRNMSGNEKTTNVLNLLTHLPSDEDMALDGRPQGVRGAMEEFMLLRGALEAAREIPASAWKERLRNAPWKKKDDLLGMILLRAVEHASVAVLYAPIAAEHMGGMHDTLYDLTVEMATELSQIRPKHSKAMVAANLALHRCNVPLLPSNQLEAAVAQAKQDNRPYHQAWLLVAQVWAAAEEGGCTRAHLQKLVKDANALLKTTASWLFTRSRNVLACEIKSVELLVQQLGGEERVAPIDRKLRGLMLNKAASVLEKTPGVVLSCALCDNCSVHLRKCGRCKRVAYCNVTCQKLDWRNHKKSCKKSG
jgi:hypothetical protein